MMKSAATIINQKLEGRFGFTAVEAAPWPFGLVNSFSISDQAFNHREHGG
jgi:hypothetical protein